MLNLEVRHSPKHQHVEICSSYAQAAQVGVKIIAVAVALEPVTLPDGEKIELQWKYVGCLPVHLK
eukprot:1160427-Pelagomonas_calceolata.AAC.4